MCHVCAASDLAVVTEQPILEALQFLAVIPLSASTMYRTIRLALSDFPTTPTSLRKIPAVDEAKEEIDIDLANLFHHYYNDKHGKVPPDPDPVQFEHLQYLTTDKEFRVQGSGLGPTSASRRAHSNELGHAFCRLFLHDHLNITYFAHIEHVLRWGALNKFGNVKVERIGPGDTPDYFCADHTNAIFLAEAKGRHSAINFANAGFASWREQFNTVLVTDASGSPCSVKGFIVATRFATESKPNTKSVLYAEDPLTPGERSLSPDDTPRLRRAVVSLHYADIASKLNQPILADALLQGYAVPEEIRFLGTVWTLRVGPFAGTRFVGGYYPTGGGPVTAREVDGQIVFGGADPLRLDVDFGTFFGVEEKIFKQVAGLARGAQTTAPEIGQFDQIQPFYSAVSILRDGSTIGPLEFFTPTAPGTY